MNNINSILLSDGYKLGHHKQYPINTTLVFSNFTPRSDKYAPVSCQDTGVVVFGIQMMLQMIHEHFEKNFFKRNYIDNEHDRIVSYIQGDKQLYDEISHRVKIETLKEIKEEIDFYLGSDYDITHFEELWDLGYLPIEVRALDEGTICPIKVPMLTIHNTHKKFFWITNYLETIISNLLWKPITSATIAKVYKETFVHWAKETDKDNIAFTDWQGHDFSMRGMDSIDATISSGLGHLTSFLGTDSLPAVYGARKYYNEIGFIAGSVPATEHSVMSAGSKENELDTFKRLMKVYPTGILSVVSDTWDLWNVITNILPQLETQILGRDGKLVIRPDSGDPVDILCGLNIKEYDSLEEAKYSFEDNLADNQVHGEPMFNCDTKITVKVLDKYYTLEGKVDWNRYDKQYYFIENHNTIVEEILFKAEYKGVIELLWDIFGGTINEQGYKVLDPHIGAIYGDSITTDRAWEICQRLEAKGFASTNVVLGIGSFTYQYNTRDTFGFAMKATYIEKDIEGLYESKPFTEGFEISKDPITDNGMKKSAKGLLKVVKDGNIIKLKDGITWDELRQEDNLLTIKYVNGQLFNNTTLTEIRERLK